MVSARFIGVGVSEYDKGHEQLPCALSDVESFAALLGPGFDVSVLANPDEDAVRTQLRAVRGSMSDGVVLLWSGHAAHSADGGLRLLARDSGGFQSAGFAAAGEVAVWCAESGATQLLFIHDTCFSGTAIPVSEVANGILRESAFQGDRIWAGVLASCLSAETAKDGLFGERLAGLLQSGPNIPELRVRWSPHSVSIRGDDLCA